MQSTLTKRLISQSLTHLLFPLLGPWPTFLECGGERKWLSISRGPWANFANEHFCVNRTFKENCSLSIDCINISSGASGSKEDLQRSFLRVWWGRKRGCSWGRNKTQWGVPHTWSHVKNGSLASVRSEAGVLKSIMEWVSLGRINLSAFPRNPAGRPARLMARSLAHNEVCYPGTRSWIYYGVHNWAAWRRHLYKSCI